MAHSHSLHTVHFMQEKAKHHNAHHMEIVTMKSKAKEAACECRSHRRDAAGGDTHTGYKDIGQLPGRIRDKEIEESLSSVSFGLFSL